MLSNYNLNNIFLIPLFFVFLPTFCLLLGNGTLSFFFLTLITAYIIFIVLKFDKFITIVFLSLKRKPMKMFGIWCLWILLSSIYTFFAHNNLSFFNFYIKNMGICLLFSICMTLFFPIFLINNRKTLKFIIKFIYIGIICVVLLGILNYIGINFSIGIIQKFFDIIVNKRVMTVFKETGFSAGRVFSVFAESAWFANWLVINLPIVDAISKSKYKIFHNNVLNRISKKILLPIYILVLYLTKSPIWIILGSIIFIILNIKSFKKFIYYLIPAVIVFFVLFNLLQSIDIDKNSVTRRIYITYSTAFTNYQSFSQKENNLATRITSYYNLLRMFKEHPFVGVGLNNTIYHMYRYFITSELPLTSENLKALKQSGTTYIVKHNGSIIYELLAETGIIGTLLFYYFIICILRYLNFSIKCSPSSIINDFSKGLYKSIIVLYFICAFYDTGFTSTYNFIILGIAYSTYKINMHFIPIKKQEVNKNNDIC